MTTVDTQITAAADDDLQQDSLLETAPVPGTELEATPPRSTIEIAEAGEDEIVEGEIVEGPVHLNTGEQPAQMPFRAGVLDARLLRESTKFSREDLGDLDELDAAIIERGGVKLPLIVLSVREPGSDHEDFEIVDGTRRKRSAVRTGYPMVPCWILDSEDDVQLILDMLALNENHKDLQKTEIAQAYQTMLDFGWSAEQVAAARRQHVDDVRAAVRARQLPAPAQQALNQGTLTFEMVQAVDEFADSPDDQQKLLDKMDDQWRFQQELARLREKLRYQRARDLARGHLLVAEVDVTPRPRALDYGDGPVRVDQLVDVDGRPVDVDAVKTMKGFHGFVEKNGANADTVIYCDDPAAHGYTRRPAATTYYDGMSEEEAAAKQEAEHLRAERVQRLRVDAGVRREFLVPAWGTAKAAKTLFPDALRSVTIGKSLSRSVDLDELFVALGGSDAQALAAAGEDRLRRTLVAKYICHQEHNLDILLDRVAGMYTYGLDEQAVLGWYAKLTAKGYPLTEDEQAVVDELTVKLAGQATADDDDEDEIVDAEIVHGDDSAASPASPQAISAGDAEVMDVEAVADEGQDSEVPDVEAAQAQVLRASFGLGSADGFDDLNDLEDVA